MSDSYSSPVISNDSLPVYFFNFRILPVFYRMRSLRIIFRFLASTSIAIIIVKTFIETKNTKTFRSQLLGYRVLILIVILIEFSEIYFELLVFYWILLNQCTAFFLRLRVQRNIMFEILKSSSGFGSAIFAPTWFAEMTALVLTFFLGINFTKKTFQNSFHILDRILVFSLFFITNS